MSLSESSPNYNYEQTDVIYVYIDNAYEVSNCSEESIDDLEEDGDDDDDPLYCPSSDDLDIEGYDEDDDYDDDSDEPYSPSSDDLDDDDGDNSDGNDFLLKNKKKSTGGGSHHRGPTAPAADNPAISVDTNTRTPQGKRIWRKCHSCKFCHKLVTKTSTHLMRRHANRPEVSRILSLEKGSSERRLALVALQTQGDYQHNMAVLKNKSGCLIPKYRSHRCREENLLACHFCKGLYLKYRLCRHVVRCPQNPDNIRLLEKEEQAADERLMGPDVVDTSAEQQADVSMEIDNASEPSNGSKKPTDDQDGNGDQLFRPSSDDDVDDSVDDYNTLSQLQKSHSDQVDPSAPAADNPGISVDTNTRTPQGKRLWGKRHSCKFCHKLVTKTSTHLMRRHANRPEVSRILSLEKGSKERRLALVALQTQGDYQHNVAVLKNKSGCLIPKYRSRQCREENLLACHYCKGLFRKQLLSKHEHSCPQKPQVSPSDQVDPTAPAADNPGISVDSNTHTPQGKRIWGKRHSCKFCHKLLTKTSTHLIRRHADQPEVSRILSLEKGSAERRLALVALQDQGDYQHNVAVLKNKSGCLIPKYRSRQCREENLLVCPHCQRLFLKDHVQHCPQNPKVSSRSPSDEVDPSAPAADNPGISVDSTTPTPQGKRKRDKRHSCKFCHKLVTKTSTHLVTRHADQPEVSRILSLKKGSAERRLALVALQDQGDYQHNMAVLKNKSGCLIPKRRSLLCREEDLLACHFCKGLYYKYRLSKHVQRCPQKPDSDKPVEKGEQATDERLMFPDTSSEQQRDVSMDIDNPNACEPPSCSKESADNLGDSGDDNDDEAAPLRLKRSSRSPSDQSGPSAPAADNPGISVDTNTRTPQGKRVWGKRHSCKFCHKLVTKTSTHLMRRHANRPEVSRILSLEKGSKERRLALVALQTQGDYQHNVAVLKNKSGCLIPKYRSRRCREENLLACHYCKGLFLKQLLSKHVNTCSQKPDTARPMKRGEAAKYGKLMLPCPLDTSSPFYHKVYAKLRDDEVGRLIREDTLLLEFAKGKFESVDAGEEDNSQIVSARIRELGRLLKVLREKSDGKVCTLNTVISASHVDLVFASIKELAGFDGASRQFRKVNLARKLVHSLRACSKLKRSEATKQLGEGSDSESLKKEIVDAEQFDTVLNRNWTDLVLATDYLPSSGKRETNKPKLIASCRDVLKLHSLLEHKMATSCDYPTVARATLCLICLFNRRCVAAVQTMKINDFESVKNGPPSNARTFQGLRKTEKKLLNRFHHVELGRSPEGQTSVLLTPKMVDGLRRTLDLRKEVASLADSQHVFARPNGEKPYGGQAVLKEHAAEAGVSNPSIFTSRQLRRQVSTLSQAVAISELSPDQWAHFLGPNVRAHRHVARQPTQILQKAAIAKFLLCANKRMIRFDHCFRQVDDEEEMDFDDDCKRVNSENVRHETSQSADGSGSSGALPATKCFRRKQRTCPKQPWTKAEKEAVDRQLGDYFTLNKLPGKQQLEQAIDSEPALKDRSWKNVKDYVRNLLLKRNALLKQN